MLHTYAPAIFLVIVFILIRFSTVDTNTMCLRFRSDPLSRAFINRCVFGESTQRISVDGRPKRIARWCGRGLMSVTKTLGAIHLTKIPTGPTWKGGPPQKVDQFFRNFSGWTEPIH